MFISATKLFLYTLFVSTLSFGLLSYYNHMHSPIPGLSLRGERGQGNSKLQRNNVNYTKSRHECEMECGHLETMVHELYKRRKAIRRYLEVPEEQRIRRNILIFSTTGKEAKILGEVFNERQNVLYFPEVLSSLAYYLKFMPSLGFSLAIHLLRNVFRCHFNENDFFVSDLTTNPLRLRSHALSDFPICHANKPNRTDSRTLVSVNGTWCSVFDANTIFGICRRNAVTVAQTALIKSLQSLSVLHGYPRTFRFKVIHLVRDPRATIYDILKKHKLNNEAVKSVAFKLCNRMVLNLNEGRSSHAWRNGNSYKLIRFEDFVSQPYTVISDLMRFTELSVQDYRYQQLNLKNIHAWKKEMAKDKIREVEEECGKAMEFLRYEKVHDTDRV